MNARISGCLLLTAFFLLTSSVVKANESSAIEVVYEKESRQLLTTREDFFSEFGFRMLPGDTYTDKAVLKNNTENEIELFFKTQPLEKSTYGLDENFQLLKEIQLSIALVKDGKKETLYEGALAGEDVSDYRSLGNYEANEEGDFIFTIHIPETLTNEYNMTKIRVKWIFAVNEILPETPQTEDNSKISMYILILLASVVLMIFFVCGRCKEENKG